MKKLKFYYIIGLFILLSSGCGKDFLDINKDPYAARNYNLGQMLTQSELHLANFYGFGGVGFGQVLATWVHHGNCRANSYVLQTDSYQVETPWENIYTGALEDLKIIIEKGTEEGNMIYVGIAKILKAQLFSLLVDMYGNVPFSQANNFLEYPKPIYDKGEDIYKQLFPLIDEAIADLQNTTAANKFTPGENDIYYGGDPSRWIRYAKTMKLKLYNTVRNVSGIYNEAEVNALLNDDIINNIEDDFQCIYYPITDPEARNPGYSTEYDDANSWFFVSPWFYETLMGFRSDIFRGIADPRMPYYWFNQLGGGREPDNAPEYWHGDFVTKIFGSDGPNANSDINNSHTVYGIYPIGGRYDDGQGGTVDRNSGTGAAPQRILCYYDVLYIRAELAQVGKTSENARDLLEQAIHASFAKVDWVVEHSGTNQNVPVLAGTYDDYLNAVMEEYDAEDEDGKLEIIMTQKWIANFGSTVECYNDYRRTGYPVMYDPNTHVFANGPDGHADFTSVSRGYANSFPYPENDQLLNANSPEQKNINDASGKVFWAK